MKVSDSFNLCLHKLLIYTVRNIIILSIYSSFLSLTYISFSVPKAEKQKFLRFFFFFFTVGSGQIRDGKSKCQHSRNQQTEMDWNG